MEYEDFGKLSGRGAQQDAIYAILFECRDLLRKIAGVEAPKPKPKSVPVPEPEPEPESKPEQIKIGGREIQQPKPEDDLLDTSPPPEKKDKKLLKFNKKGVKPNRRKR